jgi:hypothetical protein
MTEVVKVGVSPDTLYTLTFETGFSNDDLLFIVNKASEEEREEDDIPAEEEVNTLFNQGEQS